MVIGEEETTLTEEQGDENGDDVYLEAPPVKGQPGHDYYQKVNTNMKIPHGGVCLSTSGVLLSCDPAAYVRPVAHASYLFRAGGVNSDFLRRYEKRGRDDIIYVRTAPRGVDPTSNQVFDQGTGEFPLPLAGQPGRERGGNGLPKKPAWAGVSIE
nr:Cytochrome C biogenesis CcmF C-terminal-like mitochondrial protein [Ipomoea batatas]